MLIKRLHPLPRWSDPFDDFARLKMLFKTLDDSGNPLFSESGAGVFPMLNVSATTNTYVVRAELPGIKAEELEIMVSGNNLTLSGERRIPEENKAAKYHRKERESGRFSRALTLPGPINAEKVDANLKNGILTIVIHKAEEAKPKKINIH
jgi:HSP20 family protein